MKILKNLLLVGITILGVYFFSATMGILYFKVFPKESAGSFIGSKMLLGIPLAYIFSLTLLFTAFGDKRKQWWIGVLLVPAVLFELYFDLVHIYFQIVIGLVAFGLGKGIEFAITKLRHK